MKGKIIDVENGDKIAILYCGRNRFYFVNKIVDELKDKNVIVFSGGIYENCYFPCKRVQMAYGYDLVYMVKDYIKDYDIAIINALKENFNTVETIRFLETLRKDPELNKKTFILLFGIEYEDGLTKQPITLSYYPNYHNAICDYCNKQYTFYKQDSDILVYHYVIKDLQTEKEKVYKLNKFSDNLIVEIKDENND